MKTWSVPDFVRIVEVGPRDGLQNEPERVTTADKVAFIDRLSAAGLPAIEIGAFVSPKWVPQMADSADVAAAIQRWPGTRYAALVPNACPMETHRLGQLRARAWENLVGVALANYAAPQQNGHSVAFDPIAFDEQGQSRDTLVVAAGEAAGIYLADFDLAALRACREREWLLAVDWLMAARGTRCVHLPAPFPVPL